MCPWCGSICRSVATDLDRSCDGEESRPLAVSLSSVWFPSIHSTKECTQVVIPANQQ